MIIHFIKSNYFNSYLFYSYYFFSNLSTLFPMVQPLIDVLKENRNLWEESKNVFKKYMEKGMEGITILLNPTFEKEVTELYSQRKKDFNFNDSTLK